MRDAGKGKRIFLEKNLGQCLVETRLGSGAGVYIHAVEGGGNEKDYGVMFSCFSFRMRS